MPTPTAPAQAMRRLRALKRAAIHPHPRAAELASPDQLPQFDPTLPAWPGEHVDLPSGRRIYVRVTPSREGVDPTARLLYLHGLGGSGTNWTDLAGLLRPFGHGVALDFPGFGRSPALPTGDWSQATRIAVAIEYLESTGGGPVHLIGNSMGGAVALAVAATRPDLVASLTLISPAVPDFRVIAQLRQSPMPLMLLPGFGKVVERELLKMTPRQRVMGTIRLCISQPARISAARIAEAEREVALRAGETWVATSETGSLRGLVRAQLRFGSASMWSLARRIEAPTLVVWGDGDRLVNVDRAPRLCAAIPDSRLLLLPDTGHVAMIEDPFMVARGIVALINDL